MDKEVAKLNIEHFRARLAEEVDAGRRACIRKLLEEEHRKLEKILERERGQKVRPRS